MPEKPQSQSLAILIDADNTSARHAHAIFEEIVKLGEANVRRIYGDFSGTRLAGWDKQIQSLAILQHQQPSNTTCKNGVLPGLLDIIMPSPYIQVVGREIGNGEKRTRTSLPRGTDHRSVDGHVPDRSGRRCVV